MSPLLFFLPVVALFALPKPASSYGYAFVVANNQLLSQADYSCLKQARAYASVPVICAYANSRQDPNAKANLRNAGQAGISNFALYVQPDPFSPKDARRQLEEAIEPLKGEYSIKWIWLKVSNPMEWSHSHEENVEFIDSFVRAGRDNGISVYIYTSWYDWLLITDDNKEFGGLALWYWHALGLGNYARTSGDFSDFRSFGAWSQPMAKLFSIQDATYCSRTLDWVVHNSEAGGYGVQMRQK